jgi:hypothetical protein
MSARWKLTQFVRLFHTVKGMRACDKLCRKNMSLKSILVPTLYKSLAVTRFLSLNKHKETSAYRGSFIYQY